jgi:glucose/arabinose dehydrogenase
MLRGSDVQRMELGGPLLDQVLASALLFDGTYGRVRDVVLGPDGYLYFSTSNQDGRGWPATDDDRILRIVPAQ